ncbi:MAG: sensor histidine kinase [Gemmatimonadales bacterium]
MTTIRGRLTLWYTVAMIAVMVVFGAALVIERRHPSLDELDQRLAFEADFATGWLKESFRVAGILTTVDSTPLGLIGSAPRRVLAPNISSYLEGARDPLIVADSGGGILYSTDEARQLGYAALEQLLGLLAVQPTARTTGAVQLRPGLGPYRYMLEPVTGAGPDIAALVVATPTQVSTVEPRSLIRSMLVVAPFILVASVGLGYFLAGRSLRPIDAMMDELEAITDGRSLHRRLMVPRSADEMARLAMTANGMIARLEQSFSSLRRFTADASHELKTPLMVVRAGVERALTNPGTPAEAIELLDETLNQINRMSELVETLLTLARADEGRPQLAVTDTDLRALVAEAVETAGMLAEQANLTVVANLPDQPVLLAVDAGRIRQLLLNLVTNAVKYTPPGGTVSVALVERESEIQFAVKDTGVGIAAGDLPHVFDRFWRADMVRTRSGDRPGFGLGLSISRWIAEAHGGSIGVQSRPGRGSTFVVTLPRQPAASTLPPEEPGT